MKDLTAADMLNIWEQGLQQPSLQRAFILLSAAFPGMEPDTLLELSIGRRDQLLLQVRKYLFGPKLVNTAICPKCNEQIEWENEAKDFMAETDTPDFFEFQKDDYLLRFRLPNSLDIVAVAHADSPETAQRALVERCLLKAERSGSACPADDLPEEIVQNLMREIEESDPMAEIRIRLTCPACSHDWEVLFDINSFLWTEINDWAVRMLQTVHKLAVGYGWTEQEIFTLSPVRRQLYLGMLES